MDMNTKKRNLDCAILFMQQEHAQTLKGLHEEISLLQKKCSEMTFQMAMSNTFISQEDEFREKSELLAKDLSTEQKKSKSLEEELSEKDKRIRLLEQQLKAHDRKMQDLRKQEKHTIQDFTAQLDRKAEAVVYLTREILDLRKKLSQLQTDEIHMNASYQERLHSASSEEGFRQRDFAPPRDIRRSGRTQGSTLVPVPPKNVSRHRPIMGRRLPEKPGTPESIPDPTPFLLQPDQDELRLSKKEKSILPPINPLTNRSREIIPPQKTDSFTFVKKGLQNIETLSRSSPEVEVETLAMGDLTRRDHNLRRAQEYNSTD